MKAVSTIPYKYGKTGDRRNLSLVPDGLLCVPALEFNHFTRTMPCVDEHRHPGCIEIILCLRGFLTFSFSGVAVSLTPGQVLVIQEEAQHRLATNQRGLVTYGMILRVDQTAPLLALPRAESEVLRQTLLELPRHPFVFDDRIRMAFRSLFDTVDSMEVGARRSLIMRGAVLDILLRLLESVQRKECHSPLHTRIAKVVALMRAQPEDDYPAEWIARQAAASDTLVNTHFKKITGLPPYAFLISCRLIKANELLLSSAISITELANYFKFSSSQHFTAQFKRFFGVTPTQARKLATKGQ